MKDLDDDPDFPFQLLKKGNSQQWGINSALQLNLEKSDTTNILHGILIKATHFSAVKDNFWTESIDLRICRSNKSWQKFGNKYGYQMAKLRICHVSFTHL